MSGNDEIYYDGPWYEHIEDGKSVYWGYPPEGINYTDVNLDEQFPYMEVISCQECFPARYTATVPEDKVEYVMAEMKKYGYSVSKANN